MKYYGYLYHKTLECEAENRNEARLKMMAKLIELIETDGVDVSMVVWDKDSGDYKKEKGDGV